MDIKIKGLKLENFKCHGCLNLHFNGGSATIYGDNATGKTSVYDAFVWLLFGKDSQGIGEKNMEIKPLNASGEVKDHQAITEVEAVLLVDGEEVSLRRSYREVWSTKRGSTEASYDGNTSDYYVDGVPCKKNAFDERVQTIVPEDTFRTLTSVSYFPGALPWQKRREILFQIAGVADDRMILETDGRFAPLLEAMGKASLDDCKRRLLSEKKGYLGTRDEIPARISECQKTVADLADLDFDGARAELELLSARKDALAGQLIAIDRSSAAESKRNELDRARLELQKLEMDNAAFRREQESARPDTAGIKQTIAGLRRQQGLAQASNRSIHDDIVRYDQRISECRERWKQANGETFSGAVCPTCGQNLPADQQAAARERFETSRQKRLKEAIADADRWKRERENAEKRISENDAMLSQTELDIKALEDQLLNAQSATSSVQDMDGFAEKAASMQAWISQLDGELDALNRDANAAGREIREQIASVDGQIRKAMEVISRQSTLEYAQSRIGKLREDAAAATEKLQAVEKLLFLMEEFTRYKTSFVEDTVNSLFRLARFRLFRVQANGGVEERCDVTYGGVPYLGLNSGMRINVGIDIINTLSHAYGVRVPLFIDNAESVTRLEEAETQLIRLVVSENDKELRITYEN